jgi:drug/metabolite transporter (DMT)-like permease
LIGGIRRTAINSNAMKPVDPKAFERKAAEAVRPRIGHDPYVIRTVMNRADWLILGTLALIWGGAFFFIGVAVRHVPPLTYVLLRLSIAAAAMWLFLRLKGRSVDLPRSVWGSIRLLALLNNALPFALFGWSQTHIASGLASILNATTPIWGVLVAHFLTHDERMSPRKIAGVLLGFGGVATMIGPSLLSSLGSSALAQLACVTASLSYALAAVWARRFRKMGVSPLSVTTGQLTAGAAIMLPIALLVEQPWTRAFPPLTAIGAIVALALLCTAFGYVLYFRLIETSGATNALLVTLLVPPVAILLGGLFLGEHLATQDFLGLALIALGLAAIDGRLLSFLARRRQLRTAA